MKRADRSEKLKDRSNYKETVVKTALRKYLCGEAKERVALAIAKRVESFSKAINLATIAQCGLLKELFDGQQDVKSVEIPDIFEATFIRQLMLGVEDAKKPFEEIQNYHTKYPFLIPNVQRFQGDRNIYSAGATQYITNFKNSLFLNFDGRLKQFLRRCQDVYGFSDDEKTLAFYQIMGWKVPFSLKTTEISSIQLQAIVKEQRSILNFQSNEKVGPQWLKSDETRKNTLRQWVFFNRFYEANKFKQFVISPIACIRNKFITIDASVLYGILKELNITDAKSDKKFLENLEEHWKSVLKIKKLTKHSKSKEFTGTINTDGLSLCTHLKELKGAATNTFGGEKCEEIIFDEKVDRILSCDPGRTNILTIVEKIFGSEAFKSYILTRKQYYSDSGVFEAREKSETWNKGIKDELEALSAVSIKGVDLKSHNDYIETFLRVKDALWEEYSKRRWARQRLELYGGKKRVFAKFFNEIIKNGDANATIKMFYGSAKFAPGSTNELSVPTSRAFRECLARFVVKLVSEFRTSKIHYETDTVLEGINNKIYKSVNQENTKRSRQKVNSKRNETLRGLLWYRSTIQKESKFVDRDINAAKNIYRCGILHERPKILCQDKKAKKLEFTIGKSIRTLHYKY